MTDRPLLEIEQIVTRHGGDLNGPAGPVLAVSSRTYDILPTVARIAEVLHPGLTLGEKVQQLLVRLENGVPAAIAEVAGVVGTRLSRADYLRLLRASLTTLNALRNASDASLLPCVAGDADKLAELRKTAAEPQFPASARPLVLCSPAGRLNAADGCRSSAIPSWLRRRPTWVDERILQSYTKQLLF